MHSSLFHFYEFYYSVLLGIKKFKGDYLHTWAYRNPDNFSGKRVVVVGIGNSGADVAGEICTVAEQVTRVGDGKSLHCLSNASLSVSLNRRLPSMVMASFSSDFM